MIEHGAKITDKQCAVECVQHGAKYIVSGDKVPQVANQDNKQLQAFAGDRLKVTGDVKGDDTITVTNVDKGK